MSSIDIIGSGLAGSEAAWTLAEAGYRVRLFEMRPLKQTEAHHTGNAAELVCSNSFKSKDPVSGPGMLKAEFDIMGSLILKCASVSEVPGGQALAVDREKFSEAVTKALSNHPHITRVNQEVVAPQPGIPTIIATGPLTSEPLGQWLALTTGQTDLYFYDAIAPIIDATTIDMDSAFLANRNEKGGEAAYINCPMNEAEYNAFIDALIAAEKVPPKNFEKEIFFQGCQPIEAIAATGRDSLRFGPMRPVGLTDPRTGRRPYAVIQLRPENVGKTAYNLVGFQTKLKYGEQKRVFSLIPALKNAEYIRLGSMHRNTYVCGPKALRADLSLKSQPLVYLAGQITGVEGYLESAACGRLVAQFLIQRLKGLSHSAPPANTAMGALLRHITGSDPDRYQPANVHFGLFDPIHFNGLERFTKQKDRFKQEMATQARGNLEEWWTVQVSSVKPGVCECATGSS